MNKPRVFVPQEPCRLDLPSRLWVPTIDLTPAKRFGEIVIMLPPQASRLNVAPNVQVLKDRMIDFSEQDWVVAVGDPTLMAAACCIAARLTGGRLRMLKWDRRLTDYIETEIRV